MRRVALTPLVLASGLAVAGAVFVTACSLLAGSTPRVNVLFISVDTLRADRLHAYGYSRETSPAIDALARDGVIFSQACAQKGSTWPSLHSVMTGQYPITHGVRMNGLELKPSHVTLAEILRKAGYRTAAFLTNMTNAPNRGFETKVFWNDFIQEQTFWDREITQEAVTWLKERPRGERFFAWVHYMDPHKPYHPPAPYDAAFDPDYTGPMNGDDDQLDAITLQKLDPPERDVAHVQALYDGQVLSTDRYIDRVLKALDESGHRDDTLVVFFTDHGEELLDHNHYFFHTCSMYDGVVRIAIVMRLPEVLPKGKVVDEQVEEIDILPTVLDILGLPWSREIEGESLRPIIQDTGQKKNPYAFIEYAEQPPARILAIRTPKWKYIYNPDQFEPKNPPYRWDGKVGFPYQKFELYDLDADPREQKNVLAEHPKVARDLANRLLTWFGEHRNREGAAGGMTPDIEEDLRALGYIAPSHSSPPPPPSPQKKPAIIAEPTPTQKGAEPDHITVQHVLISFQGRGIPKTTRTMEEAKKLAEEILDRAKKGESFDDLVKRYTDDSPPGIYKMANKGVAAAQGEYPRELMVPAFGEVGFPLEVGQIGMAEFDAKKSPYGWHIIKRIE